MTEATGCKTESVLDALVDAFTRSPDDAEAAGLILASGVRTISPHGGQDAREIALSQLLAAAIYDIVYRKDCIRDLLDTLEQIGDIQSRAREEFGE